jgi:serine/threonine protein kinase
MLAGNRLTSLPDSMKSCQELELVRLSSNSFPSLPDWFLKLPNLTWLAASGNPAVLPAAPMSPVLEESDGDDKGYNSDGAIQRIPASQLTIREVLGEGASGVVYKADWKQQGDDEELSQVVQVAIKVFKGEMTSDGLPMDELRGTLQLAEFISQEHATDDRGASAALQADYPITPVLGVITKGSSIVSQLPSAADGADTVHLTAGGLVMQLIDSKYKILGGPPSFDTITRDTFEDSPYSSNNNSNTSNNSKVPMSPQVAMDLSRYLTHAIMELHAAHLTHGDIYAHNLLASIPESKKDGTSTVSVRLCDLGASTYVGPATGVPTELSEKLKALELRSLGKFMDDLLMHLVAGSGKGGDDPQRTTLATARSMALSSASLLQGNHADWPTDNFLSSPEAPSSTMEALTMVHTLLLS